MGSKDPMSVSIIPMCLYTILIHIHISNNWIKWSFHRCSFRIPNATSLFPHMWFSHEFFLSASLEYLYIKVVYWWMYPRCSPYVLSSHIGNNRIKWYQWTFCMCFFSILQDLHLCQHIQHWFKYSNSSPFSGKIHW